MAKTKELTVTLGRVITDNNYGSMKFEVGETVSLEKGDDAKLEHKRLEKRVGIRFNNLMKTIKRKG